MKKIKRVRVFPIEEDDDKLIVAFRMTEKCNHKCYYCGWHDDSVPFMDKNEILFLFSQIKKYSNKARYDFYFTGGEPTLYPNFAGFLEDVDKMFDGSCRFQVQSNGDLSTKFYHDITSRGYADRLFFSCSLQYHQIKDIEKWKQNMTILNKAGCLTDVELLLERDDPDKMIELFYHFKDIEKVNVNLIPIDWDPTAEETYKQLMDEEAGMGKQYLYEYDDGTSELIYDVDVKSKNLNNFMMMKCDGGYKHIIVKENGDVSICLADQESVARQKVNLYKNPEKLYDLTSRPQICLWKVCHCEIWLEKQR